MDEYNFEISEEDTPQRPQTGLNQLGMQEDQSCSPLKHLIWNIQMFLIWTDWGARDGEDEACCALHRGRISAELVAMNKLMIQKESVVFYTPKTANINETLYHEDHEKKNEHIKLCGMSDSSLSFGSQSVK